MRDKIGESIGFFRATALGGLLFLLPFSVVTGLLAYVYSFVVVVYEPIKDAIPVHSAAGVALLFGLTVAGLLGLCFLAGLMAHRAIGRQFSRLIEKYLAIVFPKYVIYKDLLAGNIGGTRDVPSLKPIVVQTADCQRIAFEADRAANGNVVVFFPGAPDAWIGHIGIVEEHCVRPLDVPFNDVVGLIEQLGRDSSAMLSKVLTD